MVYAAAARTDGGTIGSSTVVQPATPAASVYLTGSPYGTAIPTLYGRCQLDGVPLWSGPIVDATTTTGQTVSFAVAFGRPSPLATSAVLKRLWINSILVFDADNSVLQAGLVYRFYPGSEDQSADPAIVADKTAALTPAFRGLMYIVIDSYLLDWSGGIYPVVSADISQGASSVNVVTPFSPSSDFADLEEVFIDWTDNTAYFLASDRTTFSTYDLTTGHLTSTMLLDNVRNDFSFGTPWNDGDYFYLNIASVTDSENVYMINKRTGQQYLSPDMSFSDYIRVGKGYDDIDEVILIGYLVFDGFAIYGRQGTTWITRGGLADPTMINSAQWQEVPGVNVNDVPLIGNTGIITDADATVTPADPSKFSIFYAAGIDGKVRRVVVSAQSVGTDAPAYVPANQVPAGQVAVLNRMEAVWTLVPAADANGHPTGGTVGKYQRVLYSLCMSTAIDVIFDYGGSNFNIYAMFCGTADTPYLTLLVFDTSTSKTYIDVYSTPWNMSLPNPQNLAFDAVTGTPDGTEYTLPTAATIAGGYTQLVRTEIPNTWINILWTIAHEARPKGSNTIVLLNNANNDMMLVNLSNGAVKTYPRSGAVYNRVDGSNIANFTHNVDIYFPDKNKMFYYMQITGVGDAPEDWPGFYTIDGSTDGSYNLKLFIEELCLSVGLTDDQLAFVNVDTIEITGGIINTSVKLIDVLTQVCELFRIDIVETSGQLKFIGKSDDTLVINKTLAASDLAFVDQTSTDDGSLLLNMMASTSDLPAILFVNYLDFDNGCLIGTQSDRRTKVPVPTTASLATLTLNVPVVMSSTDAAFYITRCLYDLWAGLITNEFRLGQANIALEAGDYLSVTSDGTTYIVKVSNATLNADFSVSIQATTITHYRAFAKPSTIKSPRALQSVRAGDTFDGFFIGNLLLTPDDNSINDGTFPYYWAAKGKATLHQDTDGTYTQVDSLEQAPSIGTASNHLRKRGNAWPQIDDDTVLMVSFNSDVPLIPFTDTDAAFQGGTNACLIGSNALGWELVYYRHMYVMPNGAYSFSRFLRGQRGTDGLVDQHSNGESVIFFTLDTLAKMKLAISTFGQFINLKAVPVNVSATSAQATPSTFTSRGGPLRPLAPVNITASRDHSTLDLTFTWNRRSRISGGLHDGDGDQSLDEATELYAFQIMSDDGTEVLRSFQNLTTEQATYTAAQQTADSVDTSKDTINVTVYQISADVGAGYPGKKLCPIILT